MEDDRIAPRLQLALREALRARDTIAVSALRSALAAIDNADRLRREAGILQSTLESTKSVRRAAAD